MKYRPTRSKKWANYRRNKRIIQEYGFTEAKRLGFLTKKKKKST
jgi:hypothetical protein